MNGILPLETILPLPFVCFYLTIVATILAVMLWCIDSVAALKCNKYEYKSSVARLLNKGSEHGMERSGM